MKSFLAPFLFLFICFLSCSKSSNNTGGSNNGGGNTGGGGTVSDITVSVISPATPYPDDEITITGTGFNPDPQKDTVYFGANQGNSFIYYNNGSDDTTFTANIISATATKLVIKPKNINDYFDLENKNFAIGNYLPQTRLQIKTNGKQVRTSIIPYKHRIFITPVGTGDIVAKVQGCTYYAQPGDSLQMQGSGYRYKPSKLYINNTEITAAVFDSLSPSYDVCRFRIPKSIFNKTTEDNCTGITAKLKVVNADGKSFEREFTTVPSPPMVISSASFDKSSYKNGTDNNAMMTIKGYSLYSTTMVRVSSSNGYQNEFNVTGITGYPDQVVLTIDLNTLPIPTGNTTYNIQIKKSASDSYAFAIASFVYHP